MTGIVTSYMMFKFGSKENFLQLRCSNVLRHSICKVVLCEPKLDLITLQEKSPSNRPSWSLDPYGFLTVSVRPTERSRSEHEEIQFKMETLNC